MLEGDRSSKENRSSPRLPQSQNCSNWTGRHLEAVRACPCKLDGNEVVGGRFPGAEMKGGGGAVERAGELLTSSPNPMVPSEVCRLHLQHLMILTGPTRAPSGLLCLPDQCPLSWAHPSVTRSSSCSQPLEQPRPSPLQIGSQQPLGDPFSAIVSGQMAFPPARCSCRPSPDCLLLLGKGGR